jgi:TetR/AcrR family transcriptional regulator, transcriptional repressor for nem operon
MADLPPGRDRLAAGMNAYLDGCLAEPATKALLVQSRTEAGLNDLVATRNNSSATVILPDLEALGWASAQPIAALLVAAVAEIALVELDARQADDELRRGLLRMATRTPTAD